MWHTLWLIGLGVVGLLFMLWLPLFVCYWVKDMKEDITRK